MPHNCFPTVLPDLPFGYQMDHNQPFQLSALPNQELEPIPICENCWYNACVTYDTADINVLSAWLTLNAGDWAMLRGQGNGFAPVNAVSHDLYEYLYPLHARERRTCSAILRYDASWPVGAAGFKLKYRVMYTVPGKAVAVGPLYLTENVLKQYPGGIDAMVNFWYNPGDTHNLCAEFMRGLLAQDPSANTMLWGKLPMAEACCIFWMYNANRLGEWAPGMTLRK
jgi:hypothetical protein